jgi:hypothetical protein
VRDLALDPLTGDLKLSRGADGLRRAELTSGADAVRQKLHLRLGLVAGEYPFDLGVGIPLFTQVLGKAGGFAVAEGVYRRAVSTCPGVRSVEAFRFSVSTARRASVSFTVTPVEGAAITVTDFAAGAA